LRPSCGCESQAFGAQHGYCKEPSVSQHEVERRYGQQAMLYVMRAVALPNMCQNQRPRAVALLLWCALGCARTGLYPGELEGNEHGAGTSGSAVGGAGGSHTSGGSANEPLPASGAQNQAGEPATPKPDPPGCEPAGEACNGRDDDCNGAIDDMAPQSCPGGGARFCVAGRMSDCPKRCEECIPGSVRICQNPFCTFWGEQHCAADGQGFGHCREAEPPPECAGVARKHQQSVELQQCCLDNGYCCLDEHDLDRDGDRREMLGACGDVACQ
jgi:hypothetical protein